MRITIPSVLHPTERAYYVNSCATENWDKRGEQNLWIGLTMFKTFGDGLTQHSGDWCVPVGEMTDACLSMTAAIHKQVHGLSDVAQDANGEGTNVWVRSNLDFMLQPVQSVEIEFALSVRFREDAVKPSWFSLSERKVTTADKRNDRRYERVEARHTGDARSALFMLRQRHWDFLQYVACIELIRRHPSVGYMSRETLDPWFEKEDTHLGPGDWYQAYRALVCAVEGLTGLHNSARVFQCALNNSRPKPEPEAQEVA